MDGERKLSDILVRPENPALDAAEVRSAKIVERAQLNEAIRVIEELEDEVVHMTIANRFSRNAKPSENPNTGYLKANMSPVLQGLTEDEYKRQTLLIKLQNIKTAITVEIDHLREVIMDIEATKTDG